MIVEPYVLFTRVPLFRDNDGSFHADRLWAKDLALHFEYIADFRICCPVMSMPVARETLVPIVLAAEQVVPLEADGGWGSVFANLLPNLAAVRRALCGRVVAHSDGAGWAFPVSYYLLLLRPIVRFRWFMVIESTFWMTKGNSRAGLRTRLTDPIHGLLLRGCLAFADARLFTQPWYRDVLLGHSRNTLITPAAWIDEDVVAQSVNRHDGELRLVFPSRLAEDKGVDIVLRAILSYRGQPMELAIIGEGPLATRVRELVGRYDGPLRLSFRDPIPYGPAFFSYLRQFDAVLIAALTQEQPRIVFDAFSQGVPCVASNTAGNASVIEDGQSGLLYEAGSAQALARLLERLAFSPGTLRGMRSKALGVARRFSHRQMHRDREKFLTDSLGLYSHRPSAPGQ